MKSLKYSTFIIALFIATINLNGQTTNEILTQSQFIDIILKYHPVSKQADINIEKAKADILIARGGFDPLLTATTTQKTFDGTEYYNYVQPELRIPTWYGIEVVAGAEYLKGNRTNAEETLGKTSYAGLVVPLAKNLIIDKRRAMLQTAKVFRNLSEVEKRSTLNNLLIDALQSYWDWAYQYQQLAIINNVVTVNEKRIALVKTSVNFGDKPALDSIEAISQLQTFQYLQNEAMLLLQNAKIELSAFLWKDDVEINSLPDNIIPENNWLKESFALEPLPVLEEIMNQVRKAHPDIQQYEFLLKAMGIDKKLKFQELLPKLDFKYNQLGKGYNILNAKSGALFENNFQYGISFGIPLRLSKGRGEFRKADLKITETALKRDLKIVEIENKVKMYFNKLSTLLSQSVLLEKAYQNFLFLQRGEELKFFNGESSLFLVNSRENKSLEALQKLIKTKADYYKTYNYLQWAAGLLN